MCNYCSEEYLGVWNSASCPKISCKKEHRRRWYFKKDYGYEATEGVYLKDYIKCKICDSTVYDSISTIHLKMHKITLDQYKEKFPGEPTTPLKKSERISGSLNPGFNHGGKFSPFSENFIGCKDSAEKAKQKAKLSKENNVKPKTLEWAKKRGMTEQQYKDFIDNNSYSRKSLVKKYGEEEGNRKRDEMTKKWQNTLKSKSKDEQLSIIKKRTAHLSSKEKSRTSKPENGVADFFSNILKEEPQRQVRFVDEKNSKVYYVDFLFPEKIIVEFNGDYFHANPKIYTKDSKILRKKASEIWLRDKNKKDFFESSGYVYYVVWESDWKKNKEETEKNLKEILLCKN